MRKVELQKAVSVDKDRARSLGSEHDRLAQSIRWLWYEFTPYEVGCDEIGGESSTTPLSVATPAIAIWLKLKHPHLFCF